MSWGASKVKFESKLCELDSRKMQFSARGQKHQNINTKQHSKMVQTFEFWKTQEMNTLHGILQLLFPCI